MAIDNFGQPPRMTPAPRMSINLDILSMAELMALRERIDGILGNIRLGDIDLSNELVMQYRVTKQLFLDSSSDMETPLNQRVQAANSCSTILAALAKIQIQLYDSDRIKRLEGAVYDVFRSMDVDSGQKTELSETFLARYRAAISDATFLPRPPIEL